MVGMDDSIAQATAPAGALELPAWKSVAECVVGCFARRFFLVAGVWKITEPFDAAARMVQAKIPAEPRLNGRDQLRNRRDVRRCPAACAAVSPLGSMADGPDADRVHDLHRLLLRRAARRGMQLLSVVEASGRPRLLCG